MSYTNTTPRNCKIQHVKYTRSFEKSYQKVSISNFVSNLSHYQFINIDVSKMNPTQIGELAKALNNQTCRVSMSLNLKNNNAINFLNILSLNLLKLEITGNIEIVCLALKSIKCLQEAQLKINSNEFIHVKPSLLSPLCESLNECKRKNTNITVIIDKLLEQKINEKNNQNLARARKKRIAELLAYKTYDHNSESSSLRAIDEDFMNESHNEQNKRAFEGNKHHLIIRFNKSSIKTHPEETSYDGDISINSMNSCIDSKHVSYSDYYKVAGAYNCLSMKENNITSIDFNDGISEITDGTYESNIAKIDQTNLSIHTNEKYNELDHDDLSSLGFSINI